MLVNTVVLTDFESQLDDNPADWTLRSIYADWLEEREDPRAESMRWMVANSCVSALSTDDSLIPNQWLLERKGADEPPPINMDSLVPDEIFRCLSIDERWLHEGWWITHYPTRIAAEIDLHNALVKAGEITCALIDEVKK